MIVEVFVLALASTVRPTSLAAVYALISRDTRRGLMSAYVIAGLVFTLAFGVIVVGATHGIHVHSGRQDEGHRRHRRRRRGAGVRRRILRPGASAKAVRMTLRGPGRMKSVLDRRLTIRTAALAGPATHIPGLFYLVALNVIVAHNVALAEQGGRARHLQRGLVRAAARGAGRLHRPPGQGAGPRRVGRAVDADHARGILLLVSFGAGTALIIRGILSL